MILKFFFVIVVSLYGAGKTDGLHALLIQIPDCHNYVNRANEFHNIRSYSTVNGVPIYFDPNTNKCDTNPQSNCNLVKGFWSSWTSDGNGCSIRTNKECQSRQIRSCINPSPVNDVTSCSGSSEQFIACNSCGNAFCVGRSTGSYSKTLALTPPVNLACFSGYYICTQPGDVLTTGQCTETDYFFNPSVSACRRGQDSTCPQTYCGGKTDGFHTLSTNTHDCREYLSCSNELATVLTCENDTVSGKQMYFNAGTCSVTPPLTILGQALCNPVFGYWSSWAAGACSLVNNVCQRTRTRACSNPAPINDPNSCPGSSSEQEDCEASSCQTSCSTNPCHNTTQCSSTGVGTGYSCSCLNGYQFSSGVDGTNTLICRDIDECKTNPNSCPLDQRCQNTPDGSFTCLPAACLTNPCHITTVCMSLSTEIGYICTCPSGTRNSTGIDGTNALTCVETCIGKQKGCRISDSNNPRNYIVCDGNGGNRETLTCPNGHINLIENFLYGNGIYYSPVFHTCVNTTTGDPPAAIRRLANGRYDFNQVCKDIADEQRVPKETSSTTLPYIYDTTFKTSITCQHQKLINADLDPPVSGNCDRFYGRDNRWCTIDLQEGSCN